jgi:hypothetical protein
MRMQEEYAIAKAKKRRNIDDYQRPTEQEIKDLKHGDLVHIFWSGGNNGLYRVHINKFGNPSAISDTDYNEDGTIRAGREDMVECMIDYNPITLMNCWEINKH